MSRSAISIFFSFVFSVLIVAPTIISLLEDSFDVSIIIDLNEEENKENETKKLEIEFMQSQYIDETLLASEERILAGYHSKTYSKFYLKLHSPPPEQI